MAVRHKQPCAHFTFSSPDVLCRCLLSVLSSLLELGKSCTLGLKLCPPMFLHSCGSLLAAVDARARHDAMSPSVLDLNASKGRGWQKEINRKYAYPLPILFSPSEHSYSRASHIGLFGFRSKVEKPQCEGIFDPCTRSVWVVNSDHSMVLWQRGFFGKGSLSRSEPSWLMRRIQEQQQRAKKGKFTLYSIVKSSKITSFLSNSFDS